LGVRRHPETIGGTAAGLPLGQILGFPTDNAFLPGLSVSVGDFSSGKLLADAKQAKRAIYGGCKMARRHFEQGSLFKRETQKNVWVARWWEQVINADGSIGRTRRVEVLGAVVELGSRSRAMNVLSRRRNAINCGFYQPQSTWCYAEYIAQGWKPAVLPTLKYSTQKHYRYILDVHLVPAFGNTRLCDTKREWIESFLAAKFIFGLAWKTVKHIRGVLGRTLPTAEDGGYLTHNPALKTRLPRRPITQQPKAILAPAQVVQRQEQLEEPARAITMLLVLKGVRIGEVLTLRWKCVDLTNRILQVADTVYDGHLDTPKSQRSARTIPLAREACVVLERLRSKETQPDDLVSRTKVGHPLNRHNLLRRHLRAARDELKIPSIGWHSLRHYADLLTMPGGGGIRPARTYDDLD